MGNPEHLEILKQGVDVWNKWREENPEITPELQNTNLSNLELWHINLKQAIIKKSDLRGISLTDAILFDSDLHNSDLRNANLQNSKFDNSNLRRTDLRNSDLTGCSFCNVDFTNSDMSWADLQRANCRQAKLHNVQLICTSLISTDLSEAELGGADLWAANLNMTLLKGTNFSNAEMGSCTFGDIDLSATKGLANVEHHAPSSLGIDSIQRSKGNIPKLFLQGIGITEKFIEYILSLTSEALEFYSCFISYSSKDQELAERLYADLQNKGVRCWFAPEDMKIGDKIRQRIDHSIRIHDKLLLILSENSINSEWCEDECEAAYEEEKRRGEAVLFPVRIDNVVMDTDQAWAAKLRRSRHIGDFTNWKDHDEYQKAFDRLLRDLKAED